MSDFSIILVLKGIMTFKSERINAFFKQKCKVELKMENPKHSFQRDDPCASAYVRIAN